MLPHKHPAVLQVAETPALGAAPGTDSQMEECSFSTGVRRRQRESKLPVLLKANPVCSELLNTGQGHYEHRGTNTAQAALQNIKPSKANSLLPTASQQAAAFFDQLPGFQAAQR